MKKLLCFLLCLTLIFSSVSLSFAADWSATQISSVVSDLSTVKTTLNNIYSRLGTIVNYLYDDSHSVAYWASAIASWMQPIYQALTNNLVSALDIEPIIAGLNEVVSDGSNTSYFPYLKYNGKSNANYLYDLDSYLNINWGTSIWDGNYRYQIYMPNNSNGTAYLYNMQLHKGNYFKDLFTALMATDNASNLFNSMIVGYFNSTQSAVNWGNLGTSNFTPLSVSDGIYKWLSAIQAPVARLSYVLASEERIEAQEAAAVNEEAVVDNFIDSSGSGAASPSDIGSVSDLSSGYIQNFGSDASPSGIFDIFNSDHATWFSQETKNQLDTTTPSRMTKGSVSETPLLDKQIEDIYDALGVKQP